MKQVVFADFETLSAVDLTVVGAEVYAAHPSTEIICLVYGNDAPHTWCPTGYGAAYEDEDQLARDTNVVWVAHNSAFEQAIWRHIMVKRYGFHEIPNERWHDTMAAALYRGLPAGLDDLAKALRLPYTKDAEGSTLVKKLNREYAKTGVRPDFDLDRVVDYCVVDWRLLKDVHGHLGWLPKHNPIGEVAERQVWLTDQEINQRGLRIDVDFVRQAQRVVAKASKPLLEEFGDLTGLRPTQLDKLKHWMRLRNVWVQSLDKEAVNQLLGEEEADEDDLSRLSAQLPEPVARALYIRRLLGSSSVSKLKTMLATIGTDNRARGVLQYHGAHTGRETGRLFQPQNLHRGTNALNKIPVERKVWAIMTGDPDIVELVCGSPPIETVAACMRHAIIPAEGKVFHVGDFAGVELRGVLALAGEAEKLAMLEAGEDVYLDMANQIYKRDDLTKDNVQERTIGKNTVLGCGFQMGGDTFHDRYCPEQTIEFAHDVVRAYRKEWAPAVPILWRHLEAAALDAVKDQGELVTTPYDVSYQCDHGWLRCDLPSGRSLWYPEPRLINKLMPWLDDDEEPVWKETWAYAAPRKLISMYGGALTENVVQAFCRDILMEAIQRCDRAGLDVVLDTHDEIVVEDDEGTDFGGLKQCMLERSAWVQVMGMPIGVELWTGKRYRK